MCILRQKCVFFSPYCLPIAVWGAYCRVETVCAGYAGLQMANGKRCGWRQMCILRLAVRFSLIITTCDFPVVLIAPHSMIPLLSLPFRMVLLKTTLTNTPVNFWRPSLCSRTNRDSSKNITFSHCLNVHHLWICTHFSLSCMWYCFRFSLLDACLQTMPCD